jgi:hypothetical protein
MPEIKSLPFTALFVIQETLEKAGMSRAESADATRQIEKSSSVQRELSMPGPLDAAGIMSAVGSAAYGIPGNAARALHEPRAKLAIMGAIDAMSDEGGSSAALMLAMLGK